MKKLINPFILKPIFKKSSSGLTLIETMISVAIIAIAFIGLVASFSTISRAIQTAKLRTLASNLAQEKIQILKQISYYRITVTTSTAYRTEFNPQIPYDTGYYPPEAIFEGGINFERLTYVQTASEVNGKLVFTGSAPDSGMKAVTVTVVWLEGSEKKSYQVRSIKANPETTLINATFKGTVRNSATAAAIQGATVSVAENMGWSDSTDAAGAYQVSVYPGNYSLVVSAKGFFSQNKALAVASNQTVVNDFNLAAMSSGTVCGAAWINDHIVISQVVGSTENAEGFSQEFVELYNPTTSFWTISSGGMPSVTLKYYQESAAFPQTITLTYNTFTMAPYSYYLISNTSPVTAAGVIKTADAIYDPSNIDFPNIIKAFEADGEGSGAIGISDTSGRWIDIVGWDRSNAGKTAPAFEANGYDQGIGLQVNEQFVRYCSTSGVQSGPGRCYDSDNNNTDFTNFQPIQHAPKNSLDIDYPIAGVPAFGAVVSASDDLSIPVKAVSKGNPPYAEFRLTDVSTGTWTVIITSGLRTLEISSVTVSSDGQLVNVLNNLTNPAWISPGIYSCIHNQLAKI